MARTKCIISVADLVFRLTYKAAEYEELDGDRPDWFVYATVSQSDAAFFRVAWAWWTLRHGYMGYAEWMNACFEKIYKGEDLHGYLD